MIDRADKLAFAITALLFGSLAGCLDSSRDEGVVLCESDDDCSGGAVCDDGFCYGDPPQGIHLAAVLEPPSATAGTVLVPTEIPELSYGELGQLLDLRFARHVTIRGRVMLECSPSRPGQPCGPIEATVEARRASKIPGQGPIRRQAVAMATDDDADPTFSLSLPPSTCENEAACEDEYMLLVTPLADPEVPVGPGVLTPETLAPPQMFRLVASADMDDFDLVIGRAEDLKEATGRIVYGAGLPGVENYQVTAYSNVDGGAPFRASTKAITDESGYFTLRVARDTDDLFDLVLEPVGEDVMPTIRVNQVSIPDVFVGDTFPIVPDIEFPDVPETVEVMLPIAGFATAGGEVPVPGSTVHAFTQFPVESGAHSMTVTYTARAATGTDPDLPGHAAITLFPGRTYDVVVLPPSDSEFAAQFGLSIPISAAGFQPPIQLARRQAMRARVLNAAGEPVVGAPVDVRPSAEFLYGLPPDTVTGLAMRDIVADIRYPAVTAEDGSLFLWVDGALAGLEASYEVAIEPPVEADAPRWTFEDVTPEQNQTLDLGDLQLPRAAYGRGTIRDADGKVVPGAKLQLYQVRTADYCNESCTPPPYLRGSFLANDSGDLAGVVMPAP